MTRRTVLVAMGLALLTVALTAVWAYRTFAPVQFDGQRALAHVEAQMAFGPRPPGSDALRQTGDYIIAELESLGYLVETQEFEYLGTPARNIVGKINIGRGPVIIVGAHYDTRWFADQDPVDKTQPVPGANDGASGVAVLLELARTLDRGGVGHEIWLAFFDAEDNGGINGWDWIVGSTYMADNLLVTPEAMILADMIGDADQQIYYDANSDPALSEDLFTIAADLGYGDYFIPQVKYAMLDDHTPFMQRGIPAVDLIDFDYPYWHTTADTTDKVSALSLERVGRVIETYLESTNP